MSRYGGGYISSAQYITECLCFLIARQDKTELYDQFWKDEPWATIYKRQIPGASKLLKEYPAEVIIVMLRDKRCWKLRSLHAKSFFGHILAQKQREYDLKERAPSITTKKVDTMQKPPKRNNVGPSLISKLKGL